MIYIRNAETTDLDSISELEASCFHESLAASRNFFKTRLSVYPGHFWLAFDDDQLISMTYGLCTEVPGITDTMLILPIMHNEHGPWQMLFGLATHPDYRGQGYAEMVMNRVLGDAHSQHRRGIVINCDEGQIPYFTRFGFIDEGIATSRNAPGDRHQMRRMFR